MLPTSPGQMDAIDHVCDAYPYLSDDVVREHLDEGRS